VFAAAARTLALALAFVGAGCGLTRIQAPEPAAAQRRDLLARAAVWEPTNVASMDLWAGPQGRGAYAPGATIVCTHAEKEFGGRSPKFACRIGDEDPVKVKYGGTNGEVYGEVLATRLLWALGFGADRMYPVDVICRGCPRTLGGIAQSADERRFAPAVIERRDDASEWPLEGKEGWSWTEFGMVEPQPGGASLAERDALKLLAVFMQHSDSKPEQQRIVCRGGITETGECLVPFLMLNDVGLTFGRATLTNDNDISSVNLVAWRSTPVWKDAARCIGNLTASFTGTLSEPAIGEGGRRLLSRLLGRLTDAQLRDLFRVARVELRQRAPEDVFSGFATVQEWIDAFKNKRREITEHRCPSSSDRSLRHRAGSPRRRG
jgi:hypothetical protein